MASMCKSSRCETMPVANTSTTSAGDTSNTSDTSASDTSGTNAGPTLTTAQRARIERQRQKARALHDARLIQDHPAIKEAVSSAGSGSTRARDTGGGFLLDEDEPEIKVKKVQAPAPVVHQSEQPHCLECEKPFPMSYLFDTFDYSVCDECRNEETHSLITRTEAKTDFLLKDCDLDKREPPLKCIRRRNPHKAHYSDMRLYLRAQVEARALEVWGSEEALEEEHQARVKRREKAQETSTKRRLRELRMAARSSLFEGRKAVHGHTHEWGAETYDEDSDNYSRVCTSCGHTETYEKIKERVNGNEVEHLPLVVKTDKTHGDEEPSLPKTTSTEKNYALKTCQIKVNNTTESKPKLLPNELPNRDSPENVHEPSKDNKDKVKEIQEKIKASIIASTTDNSLKAKRQKNVAVAALLKLGLNQATTPVKLIKPDYFEKPPTEAEKEEKLVENEKELNKVPSISSSETSVNHVDQDSITKVNGWFNNIECPKPKPQVQEPVVLKDSITFKKKTISIVSAATSSNS